MTQYPDRDAPDTDPGRAFEDLRKEVSLARRALEGLTAARENLPDYSTTLGEMAQTLKAATEGLERIEQSPAVRLSPAALAQEFIKASETVRADDKRLLHEAGDALARSIGRIDGIVERGQAADRQLRRQIWCTVAGVVTGILVWAILPGMVARALPASWHVPEWMAARTIGLDRRAAALRMFEESKNGRGSSATMMVHQNMSAVP
jgi:hypothetical protein